MSLLDELQGMYGGGLQEEDDEEDELTKLIRASQQVQPQGIDPIVADATAMQPAPQPANTNNVGHPDVLNFVKELEQQGAFGEQASAKPPKGMVATAQTVTGEQGGPTAQQKAEGVAARGQFELDNGAVDAQRQNLAAQQLEERAAALRQDAAIETEARKAKEQELADKQARLRGQQMELASQNDAPIDPRRYFENMSTFAKLSSIISAGIYGYLGGKGQPPVVELLMQNAQADVQAQVQNRNANSARRNAIIEQYESQYGDSALVAKRLEADKLLTLAKEAEAKGLDAKSQDARANADDLASKLKNRVGLLHKEIQEATYGTPVKTSTTYGVPKPTGGAADSNKQLKEALEMDALLEKRGYSKEERAAMLTAAKLSPPSGKTEAELKREDETAKRAELTGEQQRDMRDRVDGLSLARQGFDEFDKAAGFSRNTGDGEVAKGGGKQAEKILPGSATQLVEAVGGAIPWGIGDDLKNYAQSQQGEELKSLRRSVDKITSGMAKANSGAGVSDKEYARYAARLPITGSESLRSASAELFREQRQEYRNMVGQYGKENIDAALRKRGIDPSIYGSVAP